MVSTEMVEKMKLRKVKHRTPYKVSWLHKGHQLMVIEQSEVEFQIGIYGDRNTCHLEAQYNLEIPHLMKYYRGYTKAS